MNYEKEILEAYSRLGYKPRGNQMSAVDQIITAFLKDGMENVLLSAPTGTGKSIIAVVVAEVLHALDEQRTTQDLASIISMGTNALVEQYYQTFRGNKNFATIKGANNYECSVTQDSGESCLLGALRSEKMDDVIAENCMKCELMQVKQKRNAVKHLITNYSYTFVDRMYSMQKLEERLLMVWDEAHTLNDAFTEHNAIHISERKLDAMIAEISKTIGLSNKTIVQRIKSLKGDLLAGLFDEGSYQHYLEELHSIYKLASEEFENMMQKCIRRGMKNFDSYTMFSRMYKKYFGLGCKIDDLTKYNYEHVVDVKGDTKKNEEFEVSVKPIFVGNMYPVLKNSRYTLFMSATLNPKFMVETLKLPYDKTEFIQLEPSFPPENKKVIIYKPISLSYKTMSDPKVVEDLLKNAADIFKLHSKQGDRGAFLTPSFAITAKLADKLRSCKTESKIFEHKQGQKLVDVLADFKEYKGLSVLLSPSMYEGIDLPDDLSRYQVIVKAPFPSLADKRMAYILKHHPDIYETLCIMKVVQGIGRSVRSEDDYAVTYLLDANLKRLFASVINVWKPEFSISHSSMLV